MGWGHRGREMCLVDVGSPGEKKLRPDSKGDFRIMLPRLCAYVLSLSFALASKSVCCTLQRPYYNGALAFVCHSEAKSDTCMANSAECAMKAAAKRDHLTKARQNREKHFLPP